VPTRDRAAGAEELPLRRTGRAAAPLRSGAVRSRVAAPTHTHTHIRLHRAELPLRSLYANIEPPPPGPDEVCVCVCVCEGAEPKMQSPPPVRLGRNLTRSTLTGLAAGDGMLVARKTGFGPRAFVRST
jgi:hypothetical protein